MSMEAVSFVLFYGVLLAVIIIDAFIPQDDRWGP